jgi:hypothetical protein
MNQYLLDIDDILKPYLQKNIRFIINNQPYKEGKFILYTHGYFSLNFNIRNYRKNKTETVKLPLPFSYEVHKSEDLLYFDYRLKTFIREHKDIENCIKDVKNQTLSKYYDKILTIETVK